MVSVLSPLVAALSALVEGGHGLVRTPDLYLHEVSSPVAALLALCLYLVHIFPSFFAS